LNCDISSIDPVVAGYVDSLARPGGNVTGLVRLARELNAKRVELLKEILPRMSRVAILWDEDGPGSAVAFKESQTAARAFKLNFQSLGVRGPSPDFDGAFQAAKSQRADALVIVGNPLTTFHLNRIMELATKSRLPSMNDDSRYVDAGGLVSYGADQLDVSRRAAIYVDKILKGAKPADLPVEQPTKFELVINLKAAKQIGLTIPPNVLARADRVIK
jgi:putative ABC transport system substrate-binding protein